MPLFATVSPAEADRAALRRQLRKLQRVFPVDALAAERTSTQQVVEYYDACQDAYRKYHSADGAVHMALNDGDRFDPDGFYGQLRRIEADWATAPTPVRDVLELAFGQGFNLAWLAPRHPQVRFHGVDLTPAHVRLAGDRLQAQGLANVQLQLGDYQALPFDDGRFDQLFCIEAMCHASDLPGALAEAARVLRPGGALTLFDGYLPRPVQQLTSEEALAVVLVAKGMAVERLQWLDDVLAQARAAGFEPRRVDALDAQVMPSLRRLERLTSAVIRWPWLGRRALARRPEMRGRNVLAGCLMRSTVALGLIGYRHLVLQKRG
ncbi:class I SAM-dependent methyltransferase [Aquabacterium sp. J223]|uniref:class I SAM-dependent methyltransferase n=1 Tax=Aquabacterium sp. J223 TaxID=2898431 RepID=UPI0021AE0D41|nr:class I SAM-dependent methyltransferase [Aquabacterium sp. J223]UUX96737.1 methyltransferase domain-containing protein [Aquabacterium sp. J223]